MSLSPYPTYQQTDLEWIESLPEHWQVKPLKRNVELLTEKTGSNECPVGLENIEGWTGRFIETESEFQGEGVDFEAGDILFGKLRPYLAKAWLADRKGEAIGDFHVLRPLSGNDPGFIQYQLLTREVIDLVNGSTYGAKMPRASWDFLGSLKMPTPSEKEQSAVANFLDQETEKIDALIAEQERLIELLQEKRQAVISHAVTKGLNPNTPMKESGVEWLGKVPEHWEVKPLKYFCRITNGFAFKSEEFVDTGIPLVRISNISREGVVDLDDVKFLPASKLDENPDKVIHQGDLLMAMTGATIGKVGKYESQEISLLNQRVCIFKSIENSYGQYLFYLLQCKVYQEYISLTAFGGAQPNISDKELLQRSLPLPPLEEQIQISQQIEKTMLGINNAVEESRKLIKLLSERRSALISAVVTGQIDVRGFATAEEVAA